MKKLTIKEHKKIGKQLTKIRDYLLELSCTIPNTYGKKSRAGLLAVKMGKDIDSLRSEMEILGYRDCPQADTEIYYPTP